MISRLKESFAAILARWSETALFAPLRSRMNKNPPILTNFNIFLPSQSILAIPRPIFELKIKIAQNGWFYPFLAWFFLIAPRPPKSLKIRLGA